MAPNNEYKSESHDQRLCYIVSQGLHLSEPREYREFVRDAKFKCRTCGRLAKRDGNLCAPEKL